MTFLNTALLFALGFIALPVIIHLFGKQRRKTEFFSSLEFLKNLQTDKMKKLRLRQLILLILRTLGVLFLVLAFLRPAFKSTNFTGAGTTHSLVLLDLSASMERSFNGYKRIDFAKEKIAEIWQSSEIVSLVILQDSDLMDIGRVEGENRDLDFLKNLNTDGRKESYEAALSRAEDILNESEATVKEIILISDFNYEVPDSLFKSLIEKYHFWSIPAGSESRAQNLFVENAAVREAVFTPGETIHLDVSFHSTKEERNETTVFLALDGKIVANAAIQISEANLTNLSFAFKCPDPGQYRGEIEIELADDLLLDNRFNFILDVPDKKRVLLGDENLLAMNHLKMALESGKQDNFQIELIKGQLSDVDFSVYDVILLSDPGSLNKATLRRLSQAVRLKGVGLWILPGERTDIPRLNRHLLKDHGDIELSFESSNSRISWERVDRTHPVFHNIVESSGTIDFPIQREAFRLKGDTKTNLVYLSNGKPCLTEISADKGKAWVSTFNADTSSGDWMVSGIFAPLVQLSALYLGNGELHFNKSLECGQEIIWRGLPVSGHQELWEVKDPIGDQLAASLSSVGQEKSLVTKDTKWPGFYSLINNRNTVKKAAVNIPVSESSRASDPLELKALKNTVIRLSEDENLSETLKSRRFGKEFSWIFLLLAFLTFIVESIIAREGRIKKA